MTTPHSTSKKRIATLLVILPFLFAGVSYFHYRAMVMPIPEFDSLKKLSIQVKSNIAERASSGSQKSFEITDQNGNRYQTGHVKPRAARAIQEALMSGSVTLFVGQWQSGLKSKSIFTIYHMTSGETVLIDYKKKEEEKKKEQKGAIPIVVASFVIFVGVVVFTLKRQFIG